MKAALVSNMVTADVAANLASMQRWIREAAAVGADLVLFPEAAATGLINDDCPERDLALGQAAPGPHTEALGALAADHAVYVAFGLLERAGNCLYDSAVLLGPSGDVLLHYRRIQPQWHGRHADPGVYRQGDHLPVCRTPLGSFGFLICGDLFDDEIVARFRALKVDWLLFPFARCFPSGVDAASEWEAGERQAYAERAAMTGSTALMVNYVADAALAGGAFGGAMAVSPAAAVLAALPPGQPGMLLVTLEGTAGGSSDPRRRGAGDTDSCGPARPG